MYTNSFVTALKASSCSPLTVKQRRCRPGIRCLFRLLSCTVPAVLPKAGCSTSSRLSAKIFSKLDLAGGFMKLDTRYAHHPEDVKSYDTETLRRHFLVEQIFVTGELTLVYTHVDLSLIHI